MQNKSEPVKCIGCDQTFATSFAMREHFAAEHYQPEPARQVLVNRSRSFGEATRMDARFMEACKAGEKVEYHAEDWVAMSREQYKAIKEAANEE